MGIEELNKVKDKLNPLLDRLRFNEKEMSIIEKIANGLVDMAPCPVDTMVKYVQSANSDATVLEVTGMLDFLEKMNVVAYHGRQVRLNYEG